jgi:hypothetical protein
MSRVISKDDNEISQDFEELMKNKNTRQTDGSDASISVESNEKDNSADLMRQQQMRQQQMMQQQMMQQQMMQQQMNQPQMNQPQNNELRDSQKNSPVRKEEFSNISSIGKTLTLLGVLFGLFFVFASSQAEGGINVLPFFSKLPYPSQFNLLIRSLLFVIIYWVLEKFVL